MQACGLFDDAGYCGNPLEFLALLALAVVIALILHPKILGSALALIGEPPSAIRRLGVPVRRVRWYRGGLIVLTLVAVFWPLGGLYSGPAEESVLRLTRPAGAAFGALLAGATCGGLALLVALAQHTLERRLGSGYASLLLGASAIGAALSVAVMDSLHVLSLIAGAIVGAAVISLYRAVDGLPWYAATAGCVVGAVMTVASDYL